MDLQYGSLDRTPRGRPPGEPAWKFRESASLLGDWRDIKNGVEGKTYTGSFERLHTKRTNFPAIQRLDRRRGKNITGQLDLGSGSFWYESKRIHGATLAKAEVDFRTSTTVFDNWRGILFPSKDDYQLCSSPTAASPLWIPFMSDFAVTNEDLRAAGASAIADLLPSVPPADVGTFLGELREGLPKMVGSQLYQKRSLRNTGGEYLNYQFGIAPTIGDVKSFIEVTRNLERHLSALNRRSTKDLRRRRVLLNERTVEETVKANAYPYYGKVPSGYTIRSGDYRVKTIIHRKIWYSGAFRQRPLKGGPELLTNVRNFLHTYGLEPTPLTVWNLSPYSWLFDWFSNAGDVISNLSYMGSNGWYQRYGYVMATTTVRREVSWQGQIRTASGAPWSACHTSMTTEHVVKQRKRASPYAFGWDFGSLNDYQKSILAALAMSRAGTRS